MQLKRTPLHWPCFLFVLLLSSQAMAQTNIDTLQHFTVDREFVSPESSEGGDSWGFIFGHSNLGYNQFAEKFYFWGEGIQVESVITYLNARAITFSESDSAGFGVYESAGNSPGLELRRKSRSYRDLRYGHPKISDATVINFDQPVPVEDSFYVSFELDSYSPNFFQRDDTIGLWVLKNGARDSSAGEQRVPARNVVQDLNNNDWEAVDEALDWHTHFAMAPVITFTEASSTGPTPYGQKAHLKVYPPYPNPAKDQVTLEYRLQKPAETAIKISDLNGKTRLQKTLGHHASGAHETPLDVSRLSPGSYVLTIYAGSAMVSTRLTIH